MYQVLSIKDNHVAGGGNLETCIKIRRFLGAKYFYISKDGVKIEETDDPEVEQGELKL